MTAQEADFQAACLKGPSAITDLTAAIDGYDDALFHEMQNAAVTTSAAAFDITKNSVVSANPQYLRGAGFWVSLQPVGGNVYIRFRPVSTNPGTTSTTGLLLVDAATLGAAGIAHFWIGKNERYMDVLGSASFNLKWWRSSERKDGKGLQAVP